MTMYMKTSQITKGIKFSDFISKAFYLRSLTWKIFHLHPRPTLRECAKNLCVKWFGRQLTQNQSWLILSCFILITLRDSGKNTTQKVNRKLRNFPSIFFCNYSVESSVMSTEMFFISKKFLGDVDYACCTSESLITFSFALFFFLVGWHLARIII